MTGGGWLPHGGQGQAGVALSISAWSSFIGSFIAFIGIVIAAPLLAQWALAFGPAEYFALMCFAFACITGLMGDAPMKAVLAAMLGLASLTVGLDSNSGVYRYTFDSVHPVRRHPVRGGGDWAVLGERDPAHAGAAPGPGTRHPCAGAQHVQPRRDGADLVGHGARIGAGLLRGRAAWCGRHHCQRHGLRWKNACATPKAPSARATSAAWPRPRRPTTPRPTAHLCHAHAGRAGSGTTAVMVGRCRSTTSRRDRRCSPSSPRWCGADCLHGGVQCAAAHHEHPHDRPLHAHAGTAQLDSGTGHRGHQRGGGMPSTPPRSTWC